MHHVVFIPGFFGFAAIGELGFFAHVREHLRRRFDEAGEPVRFHAIRTPPNSSLLDRAANVAERLAADIDEGGPIHLIGHSTGGIDARLVASPDVDFEADASVRPRVRTVLGVATPYLGTPLARSLMGRASHRALQLAATAVVFVLRKKYFGEAFGVGVRLSSWWTRLDDLLGMDETILDQFDETVFEGFDGERREELAEYLGSLDGSGGLVRQLTSDGAALLDAVLNDSDDARYGSIVTCGAQPNLDTVRDIGLKPYDIALHAAYAVLHGHVRRGVRDDLDGAVDAAALDTLEQQLGERPTSDDNDGIVPTLSQVGGQVVAAASADHLDIVGHFAGQGGRGRGEMPHVDWFPSGSGFDRHEFERVWDAGAGWMLAGAA